MSGMVNLFAKIGLIEVEKSEAEEPLNELPAKDAGAARLPTPVEFDAALVAPAEIENQVESEPALTSVSTVQESVPFTDIYNQAGLQATPFPAEKLLKLIDGLRVMDAATRKTAILAMDAADDAWTIDDAVLDAQRKINALNGYQQDLLDQVQQQEQETQKQVAALKARQEVVTQEIRKQIADLETLLERKVADGGRDLALLETELQSSRDMARRESQRMDAEKNRLQEILSQFGSSH